MSMIKRLTSVALTVVLALSPMTWPLSAYAEELAHENQASVGQRVFIDTGDGTDATGRSDADSDGQVQPEDAMDSVPGDKSDIAGAETVDVLSEIEYVYIDHQIVGLGDQQSIVVGFSSKLGALDWSSSRCAPRPEMCLLLNLLQSPMTRHSLRCLVLISPRSAVTISIA